MGDVFVRGGRDSVICSDTTRGYVRGGGGGMRPSSSHHLLSLSPCIGSDKNNGPFQGQWQVHGEGPGHRNGMALEQGLGQGLDQGLGLGNYPAGMEDGEEDDSGGLDVDRALLFVYGQDEGAVAAEVDRYEKVKMLLQTCQAQAIESADNSLHSPAAASHSMGADSPAVYPSTSTTPYSSSSQNSSVRRHSSGQGQGHQDHDPWTAAGLTRPVPPTIAGNSGGESTLPHPPLPLTGDKGQADNDGNDGNDDDSTSLLTYAQSLGN